MNPGKKFINALLWPFALIYACIVNIRNGLFNMGILSQKEFKTPVISIGNLSAGGTGKTPHTELLINILRDQYKIAVLSRGYKRKTKGYIVADNNSNAETIGDEPYQIKSKYEDVIVAVDADRCHGITNLENTLKPDIILLDDAFQHRYVKPGLSILLTDYNKLFIHDSMLPVGKLREPIKNKNRADIIFITKCPETIKATDFITLKKEIDPATHQHLYYSTFTYDDIKPVFADAVSAPVKMDDVKKENFSLLAVTGIVSPVQLYGHLQKYSGDIKSLSYPDHHSFTQKDIDEISKKFQLLDNVNKIIIVTEKDAARLVNIPLPQEIKEKTYSIGIKVAILQDKEEEFKQNILDYVRKNKRNKWFSER